MKVSSWGSLTSFCFLSLCFSFLLTHHVMSITLSIFLPLSFFLSSNLLLITLFISFSITFFLSLAFSQSRLIAFSLFLFPFLTFSLSSFIATSCIYYLAARLCKSSFTWWMYYMLTPCCVSKKIAQRIPKSLNPHFSLNDVRPKGLFTGKG